MLITALARIALTVRLSYVRLSHQKTTNETPQVGMARAAARIENAMREMESAGLHASEAVEKSVCPFRFRAALSMRPTGPRYLIDFEGRLRYLLTHEFRANP